MSVAGRPHAILLSRVSGNFPVIGASVYVQEPHDHDCAQNSYWLTAHGASPQKTPDTPSSSAITTSPRTLPGPMVTSPYGHATSLELLSLA